MTIKTLAEILEVSKPTISKVIKELDIKVEKVGNRYTINNRDDLENIIKTIVPSNNEKYLERLEKAENQNTKNANQNANIENQNAKTAKTENPVFSNPSNEYLNFLMEQIKIKDKQIETLQEQNKMLIQTQALTVKQLEQLQEPPQEPKEVVVSDEQQTKEKKWFQFWK